MPRKVIGMIIGRLFSSPVKGTNNVNNRMFSPISKTAELQPDVVLIKRMFENERLKKYRSDIPYNGTFATRSRSWLQSSDEKGTSSPWKMHLYATTTQEQIKILNAVGPYLDDRGVIWKTAANDNILQELNMTDQRGKAFTIYPRSNRDFEQIARDVDYIIRANNLTTNNSSITGDNQLGRTGRIFYRYECNSKRFKDCLFKLGGDAYDSYHDDNRGGQQYLAWDMTVQDDPWYNYNPAGPDKIFIDYINGKPVKELLSDDTEQTRFHLEKDSYYPLQNVSQIILDKNCSIPLSNQYVRQRILGLRDNESLFIGRGNDCKIKIGENHPQVSRHHVQIRRLANSFYIQDSSKNGTDVIKCSNILQ